MRLIHSVGLVVAGLMTTACSTRSGQIPEQLERLDVAVEGAAPDSGISLSGIALVEGGQRDFTVTVGGTAIKVHSPGMSDLSGLDGRNVSAELSVPDFSSGDRAIVIRDDSGLVFAADYGGGQQAINAAFGDGFVGWGTTVGTENRDDYEWEYTKAAFKTDDGTIELLPGEVSTLRINGASWRVAAVASYRSTPNEDATLPGCGGLDNLLSYELLRVDAPVAPLQLVRPADRTMAAIGCGRE